MPSRTYSVVVFVYVVEFALLGGESFRGLGWEVGDSRGVLLRLFAKSYCQ